MKLGRLYHKIGMHTAPKGTALYYAHAAVEKLYFALVHKQPGPASPPSPKKTRQDDVLVAFRISGGIGDYLIAARYIRDLMSAVGNFRFDIYGSNKAAISLAFVNCAFFHKSYEEHLFQQEEVWKEMYPVVIWISQFVKVYDEHMDKEAIEKTNPKLINKCSSIRRFTQKNDIGPFIENHPYLDNALARRAFYIGLNRYNLAQAMSGIPYGGDRLPLVLDATALPKFGLTDKKYITIHNGFDEHVSEKCTSSKSMTKIYPRFDAVVEILKEFSGDIVLVQVGTKTSVPIPGVHVNLVNKTTLPEVAAIISHAALHIDNEGGLVHFAACLGVKSCVVFGPSVADYYAYTDNINIYPRFCGGCAWATKDWLIECPRGFGEPRCLTETPPQAIADAIISYFEDKHVNQAA